MHLLIVNQKLEYFLHTFLLFLFFCCGSFFFVVHNCVINFSQLSDYSCAKASVVLDDEGNEWARFKYDKKELLENVELPLQVINAFIAAEDWNFFLHRGISWKGIARSLVVNIYHGRKAQGASTITQQLVKLLFFDSKKTFKRKIKEQVYALLVESQFTKDQIITTYLNNVCFGCGIYGIEAASQRFWSKHAHDLTYDEAATLAGIIRSPAHYCPLIYPLSSQRRRNVILKKMAHLRFITQEECDSAIAKEIVLHEKIAHCCAPHVKEMIRVFLENMVDKADLYTGGLTIKTTLNQAVQKAAQDAFTKIISRLRVEFKDDIDGGVIVIDRKTGEIKALVGGFDFACSKWNRVTQARRQIGSTIKPLLYALAYDSGITCADTDIDEPIEIIQNNNVWRPKNYNKKFAGKITLAYALSHSINTVSIKTFLKINNKELIRLAQKCGMKGTFHEYPSLALGCVDGTLYEIAGMFNVFASNGIYTEPSVVSWVKNRWGNRLYNGCAVQERIFSSKTAGHIASVLQLGPTRLKKMYGKTHWVDAEMISKTGTTNDSRTCWFVGSTPNFTTAVCVGFDDNRSMGENVYPIKTALPIWLEFNKNVEQKEKSFVFDTQLHRILVDEFTGETTSEHNPHAISLLV